MLHLGIKTDPINNRYSFGWLFDLLQEEGIKYVQLGSFSELYTLEDDYFYELKEKADARGLHIKSMFTSFRELGGFFYGDKYMERAARKNYERYIQIAAILGVDYAGSNPGAVYRDQMHLKEKGIECYLAHMQELQTLAFEKGLKALTIEPMSCLAEPPTLPREMDEMIGALMDHHSKNKNTVPVYLCGDISHGYVNSDGGIIYTNNRLFEYGIKYMAEFHFKNTDAMYNSTFGFAPEEQLKGIINLDEMKAVLENNLRNFPVNDVVGYLEINGPKTGRDYSDQLLGPSLRTSLRTLKDTIFAKKVMA
jgi:sugar phosphate isomerase/epimerase